MKRYFAAGLAALCLLAATGCNQETTTPAPTSTQKPTSAPVVDSTQEPVAKVDAGTVFVEFLNGAMLIPEVSQQDFILQVDKYGDEDQKVQGMNYDGPYGGGWSGSGKGFGYRNDYTTTEDGVHATYSNKIYATVPLSGLTLPGGITYENTITEVLRKLGVDLDPKTGFVADEEEGAVMTVAQGDKGTLTLTKCRMLDDAALYEYELRFSQTYPTTRGDGRAASVVRYVKLSFTTDGRLARMEAQVAETYKTNQ